MCRTSNELKVHFLSERNPYLKKEQLYLAVRKQEGRVLTDEQVVSLPEESPQPGLRKEWKWRKYSFDRLSRRIGQLEKRCQADGFKILDLGCGNGWLSARLAAKPAREVWAADLNLAELEQGRRVFRHENIHFVYGDILQSVFPENYFHMVVMAASVQYFPELDILLSQVNRTLKPGGYLEIIDSPFYVNEGERQAARERSRRYFEEAGFPEMIQFYHHHLLGAVDGKVMNDSFTDKLLRKFGVSGPFYWVEWVV